MDDRLWIGVISNKRDAYLHWLKSVGNFKFHILIAKFKIISCDRDTMGCEFDAIERADDWIEAEFSMHVAARIASCDNVID